jgi:type I restriction enzyme M protein
MNMFLHSFDSARIEWCDTLNSPLLAGNDRLMKFNCVVANPPFSLDKWGAEELADDPYGRFKYGLPPKSKGDYAFVQHMLASLNDKGRMGVVLPHGVLFRGGSEGKIRKGIIDDNLLDAVIGLPPNLFFGTSIPAVILIFKKGRERNDVLFIDASREFAKEKNQNRLDDAHIEKILQSYRERREVEKYAHLATLEEIRENDYNLNIPRYVDTFEEEEPVDIEATKRTIAEIEKELAEVKAQMAAYLEELGL